MNETQIDQLTEHLINITGKTGGCTIRPDGTQVTTGLACAINKKHEAKAVCLFRPAVKSWIRRQLPVLQSSEYYCIGAWHDTEAGEFVLDIVDVLPDHQLAMVLKNAKAHNQKAIYHLTTGTTLRIE